MGCAFEARCQWAFMPAWKAPTKDTGKEEVQVDLLGAPCAGLFKRTPNLINSFGAVGDLEWRIGGQNGRVQAAADLAGCPQSWTVKL
eukprot:1160828-Pelagomonas_calceolata.AAC.5